MLGELMRIHAESGPATQAAIAQAQKDARWARNQRFALDLLGLLVGATVAFVFLFVSVGLIRDGHGTEGTILGVVDIVGLVGVFVLRQYKPAPGSS